MFDRRKYKSFARQQLRGRWTVPAVITVITGLVMLIFSVPEAVELIKSAPEILSLDYSDGQSLMLLARGISRGNVSALMSYIQLAVETVFGMAAICVYLKMSRSPSPVSLSDFFDGMNGWLRAILAAIWQHIWIYLWSLLFIIPGIIKSIAYSQIMYIVAEYKGVSIPQALNISKIITQGHKMDLFIMYLSFLGWAILASVPCGLGFIWLKPYMSMTFINAYHAMLKESLETGRIKPSDLSITEEGND